MQQTQPVEFRQMFSFPLSNIPDAFWITDSRLIVLHRSGLLKSLPVVLGHRIGRRPRAPKNAEVARLARAHREALEGKCTTWAAQIYRESTNITIGPVRNGLGEIVGTIGRVEATDFQHGREVSHLSVNIIPAPTAPGGEFTTKAVADALFALNAYGVFTLDAEGVFTRWNAAMELLTGISASLARGASIASIFPAFCEPDPETLSRLGRGEHFRRCDVPFSYGERTQRYFDLSLVPLLDKAQSVLGALGILSDVTSRVLALKDRKTLCITIEKLQGSIHTAIQQVQP